MNLMKKYNKVLEQIFLNHLKMQEEPIKYKNNMKSKKVQRKVHQRKIKKCQLL